VLVLAALPVLGAARSRPGVAAALRGVNAVVVGILAAALVTPVGTSGVTSLASGAVALVGAVALLGDRTPPLLVVALSSLVLAALGAIEIA
jgi:chromate transporter